MAARRMEELGIELWMGDAAAIRATVVRKQKTDRRDAKHLLRLLLEERFPRIWVPRLEVRDVRQLLVHRHKQEARTRTKNQLQAMALSEMAPFTAPPLWCCPKGLDSALRR